MKSNAWQERRSESAKASDRIMAIEQAKDAVIEAAEKMESAKRLAISIGDGDGYRRAIDDVCAAVAHLRSVRESK